MNIVIRKANFSDIAALCGLMSELSGKVIHEAEVEQRLHYIEQSSIDSLFVLEADGAVKGALGFRLRENIEDTSCYGEISLMVVSSGERKKGLGKMLMEYAEQLAKENNCIGTWLVSGLGREEAHQFYKKLGYQINGYRFIKKS